MDAAGHYTEDLAFVHDDSFGFIARGAARTLIARLAERGIRGGEVIELACGSGISAELLAEAGFDVRGYDISPAMIELAQRRLPAASFEVRSLYDVEFEPGCAAITAIGEAFNYRADVRAGFDAVKMVFARAASALRPGGALLFDVAQPGRGLPRLEHNRWDGDGWHVTSEVVETPGARRLDRRIATVREIGGEERRNEEHHVLALYDPEEIHAALREAGLRGESLASYDGEYLFGAGHGGYLAWRV